MTITAHALRLQNRHTGELLEFTRVVKDGQPCFALRGSLPPRRQGPPLHVHHKEAEEFHVVAGTLSAEADGQRIQIGPGETATFAPGSAHRCWNDGDETLVVDGYVKPAIDLDRYLHAAFEVLNSGSADRPPLFYLAHVAWRHRRTQAAPVPASASPGAGAAADRHGRNASGPLSWNELAGRADEVHRRAGS